MPGEPGQSKRALLPRRCRWTLLRLSVCPSGLRAAPRRRRAAGTLLVFLVTGLALAAPSLASAGVRRFAAVDGRGSGACRTAATACEIHRVFDEVSRPGDDVTIEPGHYRLASSRGLFVYDRLSIHGAPGRPRPVLDFAGSDATSGNLQLGDHDTLRDIEVIGHASGAAIEGHAGELLDRVIALAAGGGFAVQVGDGSVVRDTVAVARTVRYRYYRDGHGPFSYEARGVGVEVSGRGVELRNVTAIATGSGSRGVSVASSQFCASGTCHRDPASAVAKSIIARGQATDLLVDDRACQPRPCGARLDVSHSSFRRDHVAVRRGHLDDRGHNDHASPRFVDPGRNNFHERRGSPTVDRGTRDRFSGARDLDGHPRELGRAVDIGAYELSPRRARPRAAPRFTG